MQNTEINKFLEANKPEKTDDSLYSVYKFLTDNVFKKVESTPPTQIPSKDLNSKEVNSKVIPSNDLLAADNAKKAEAEHKENVVSNSEDAKKKEAEASSAPSS